MTNLLVHEGLRGPRLLPVLGRQTIERTVLSCTSETGHDPAKIRVSEHRKELFRQLLIRLHESKLFQTGGTLERGQVTKAFEILEEDAPECRGVGDTWKGFQVR